MCSNTMTKVVGSSLGSRENRKPALAIHETPTPEEGVVSLDPELHSIGSCLMMGLLRT